MPTLTKDLENLIKIKLDANLGPVMVQETSLIPLGSQNYLYCWTTPDTCGNYYLHHMQLVRIINGNIAYSKKTIPPIKGQHPRLTGLLKELREDWIATNIDRLNELAENIIPEDQNHSNSTRFTGKKCL